jgi:hypothetical protein
MTKNSKRLCVFTLFLFLSTFVLAISHRGQRVMSAFDGAAETFRAY